MVTTDSKPTLAQRVRDRLAGRIDESEAGSMILDVMLGLALLGLIVIYASQNIGAWRQHAYEKGAMQDAQQIGTALETNYTDLQSYPAQSGTAGTISASIPATATPPAQSLASLKVNLTKNNAILGYAFDADEFRFCVEHNPGTGGDAYAWYASAKGAIVSNGRAKGCVLTDAPALTP